jgi:hypothetical protein
MFLGAEASSEVEESRGAAAAETSQSSKKTFILNVFCARVYGE